MSETEQGFEPETPRDAWRRQRVNYLGGTDAAAVLGLSRWKTPLEVWGEKTGNIVKEDISNELPVKLGNMMEPLVADLFCEATGLKVRRANETIFHPSHAFLGANIDRRIVGTDAILECKTTSSWGSKAWEGDEIPQEYILQVMHYLAVTGMKRAFLAVLIGNHDFKVKSVEADEDMIENLIQREVAFWKTFVEPKVMPMAMTSNDSDILFRMFPKQEPGKEISLGAEVDSLLERRSKLKTAITQMENEVKVIENEVKAQMQDAETAISPLHQITWKAQITQRVDVKLLETQAPEIHRRFLKESASRMFRVKGNK